MPWPSIWTHIECVESTDCWIWTGRTWKGYGRFSGGQAHRRVYERLVGPIPEGLEIDHLCLNTRCVNPDHLEPVTRLENMRRRAALQTHCINGHAFDDANTYTLKRKRQCRKCNAMAQRRRMARLKGVAT